jgi:hypothetical protein
MDRTVPVLDPFPGFSTVIIAPVFSVIAIRGCLMEVGKDS